MGTASPMMTCVSSNDRGTVWITRMPMGLWALACTNPSTVDRVK